MPPQLSSISSPIIRTRNLTKDYPIGNNETHRVLKGIDLDIAEGEFIALMGRSGGGKSTFMNIIGTLDRPSGGEYYLAGRNVSSLDDNELAAFRNRTIGFVFQNFNLIPRRSVLDNVMLPLLYAGTPQALRRDMAYSYLEQVGLQDYALRLPTQLSGGQQQRVAIARALVNAPKLLLADEPTGNLDSQTANSIMKLLATIHQSGITILLVTHELKIAGHAGRIIHFKDGVIIEDA